ncbi:MAG: response regulator [Zoogloeaceae bacterium]|nr:response regulator [Zoogloeaceae bacterium]
MIADWGVRNRVTLVATLPAVVLGLILIAFFTSSRIADLEQAHAERGRALSRQLAASAEFPLFSGNIVALGRLASSAVAQADVHRVAILDASGSLLTEAMASLPLMAGPGSQGGRRPTAATLLRFEEAVLPSRVDLDDPASAPPEANRPAALGTVVIELSRQRMEDRRTELLAIGVMALMAVLLGSLALARQMSAGVTGPIRAMAEVARRIGDGKLSERVPVAAGGSLKRLANAINDMAAHLEAAHDEMQRRVVEATAELMARKDEAERATLAKSRFLAAASHDLRQPMHALGLFISELAQHAHATETRRLVRQIAASAEAMENLLDSLLDISKLDAGVFKPNIRAFPLQPLLDRLAVDFTPMAEERRLHLRVRPTTQWVESDPALLERILINLVSNAVRYTQEGGILVACRARGNQLRIEVRDSGVGIAKEAQERIFQEFVQLENAERARNKGLGLGLAIVRRLTDLLGHSLSLRSRLGAGSVFAIEVPAAEAQGNPSLPEGERAPGDLAGTRIAIVDDDPLALTSLHSLLLSWGCQVFPADSHENLMMELATRGILPQVVISDYRLRGPRTGIDVIQALRNRFGPTMPAILISGDTAAETLRQAQEEGLVLLHKPVRPAKLRALLNRLIN